jgi:hypothetical protein
VTAALVAWRSSVDELLRGRGRFAPRVATPWTTVALLLTVAGFVHGAALGSFAGRPIACLWSGLKVPLLLAFSTLLCAPLSYALHALLGLRDDFGEAARAIVGAQAVFAIVLAATSPLLLVAYASTASYRAAVAWSGACYFVALLAAQLSLRRRYRLLERRAPRHRLTRLAFTLLYGFVAIEAAWMLRPFVGAPMLEPRFLRPDAFSNAYVVVAQLVVDLFAKR